MKIRECVLVFSLAFIPGVAAAQCPNGVCPVRYYYQAPAQYYYQSQVTQTAQPVAGDPYGFGAWLNTQRAAYGLPALSHDPSLDSCCHQNNTHQLVRGLGHFFLGHATRQNAGYGNYTTVVAMWMVSTAHRSAILDPCVRFYGIAGSGGYWTFSAR